MRLIHTLLFITVLLFTPAAALAEEPSDVTGLEAEWVDGTIKLTWDALPDDEDIAYYEIFYSHDSILSNDGEYDDFEITDGPENEFIFIEIPAGEVLYFSVMGVNADGDEGELFTEEISFVVPDEEVTPTPSNEQEPENFEGEGEDSGDDGGGSVLVPETPTATSSSMSSSSSIEVVAESSEPEMSSSSEVMVEIHSSSSSEADPAIVTVPDEEAIVTAKSVSSVSSEASESSSSEPSPYDDGRVHLLSAQSTTATEVLLVFSHPVTVLPKDAPKAFMIIDPLGRTLSITQVTIDGENVQVATATQEKGRVYQMQLADPLAGTDGQPLDQTNRVAFFTGSEQGAEPGSTIEEPTIPNVQEGNAKDVTNLELTAQSRFDKMHIVTAKWDVDMKNIPDKYIFQQTLDGGATWSAAQALNGNISGVELHGVVPGLFGLRVQAVNTNGVPSAGVFQTISLAGDRASIPVTNPPTASVLPQTPGHGGNLADTGAGVGALAFGAMGALAGLRRVRKRA